MDNDNSSSVDKLIETNAELVRDVIKMRTEIAERDQKLINAYERLFLSRAENEKLKNIIAQKDQEIISVRQPEPEMCADLINFD